MERYKSSFAFIISYNRGEATLVAPHNQRWGKCAQNPVKRHDVCQMQAISDVMLLLGCTRVCVCLWVNWKTMHKTCNSCNTWVTDYLKCRILVSAWAAGHNFLCVVYNGQQRNFCHLAEVILMFLITKTETDLINELEILLHWYVNSTFYTIKKKNRLFANYYQTGKLRSTGVNQQSFMKKGWFYKDDARFMVWKLRNWCFMLWIFFFLIFFSKMLPAVQTVFLRGFFLELRVRLPVNDRCGCLRQDAVFLSERESTSVAATFGYFSCHRRQTKAHF